MMSFNFACKENKGGLFPDKKEVITADFAQFANFFPIATLDLSAAGINQKINLVYVFLDPENKGEGLFPKGDNVDCITFEIQPDGLYKPIFSKDALKVGDLFKEDFKDFIKRFDSLKTIREEVLSAIDFVDSPEWWQWDQTPKNSRGQSMRFICQIEMYELVNDNCRLFVFYDEGDKQVKCIYQRT